LNKLDRDVGYEQIEQRPHARGIVRVPDMHAKMPQGPERVGARPSRRADQRSNIHAGLANLRIDVTVVVRILTENAGGATDEQRRSKSRRARKARGPGAVTRRILIRRDLPGILDRLPGLIGSQRIHGQRTVFDTDGRRRWERRRKGGRAAEPIAIRDESARVERHVPIATLQSALDVGHKVPDANAVTALTRQFGREGTVQRRDGIRQLRRRQAGGGIDDAAEQCDPAPAA